MSSGPSGFHNAPVTMAFVVGSAVLTVLFGIQGRSSAIGLSYQDNFRNFHPWKLIASVLGFSSTPELVFGLYLLYYFRVFERQIGSNKYSNQDLDSPFPGLIESHPASPSELAILVPLICFWHLGCATEFWNYTEPDMNDTSSQAPRLQKVFVLFSMIVSKLLEILASACLKVKDPALSILASGPYDVIFSSFVPFFFDIPVSSRFRIFGIWFSDKSFIYLAGLQLLLSSWKGSFLPGVCGILAGSLYRLNIFGIRRIKFPEAISSFFSRLGGASHLTPGASSVGSVTGAPSHQDQQLEDYPSAALNAPLSGPLEDSIATLVSMGFDRNSARQALAHAGNDVNVATNILLEAQSH